MSRAILLATLLLLAPLAGCVSLTEKMGPEVLQAASGPAPGTKDPQDTTPPSNATTGIVRVLVQAPDLSPLKGAEVSIADLTGLTGADGSVRIAGVPPGLQTLNVSKEGYRDGRIGVEVEAGAEAYVEATLARATTAPEAPKPEAPHTAVYEFEGYFDCSATYVIITGDCLTVVTNVSQLAGAPAEPGSSTNEANSFEFPLDLGWTSAILELAWRQSGSSVDGGMSLAVEPAEAPQDGEAVRYARAKSAEAPVTLRLDAGVKHEGATAEDMPNPLGGEVLRARAFQLGLADNPGGTNFLGAGASLGHRFTLYVSVFYEDAAPEDYSILGGA